jgi:hypothetical protein
VHSGAALRGATQIGKVSPLVIEGRYTDVAAPRASSAAHGLEIGRHAITVGINRPQELLGHEERLVNENLERVVRAAPGPRPERALEHLGLNQRPRHLA